MRMAKAVLPHMRAQGSGRIINISSVLGFLPAPYMATYSASKHALEGYTESLDHEIRERGVRALIVQPGGTKSSFEANTVEPDMPMEIYAEQRRIADKVALAVNEEGDDPATVAKVIVAAATDSKPKVRYTAGRQARLVSAVHRRGLRRTDPQEQQARRLRSAHGEPPTCRVPEASLTLGGTFPTAWVIGVTALYWRSC